MTAPLPAEPGTHTMPKSAKVEVTLRVTHIVKVQMQASTDRPMTDVADSALEQYQSSGGRKWASSFGSNLAITPAESRVEIESFRTLKVERW